MLRAPLLDAGFFADDFDHHAMQVGAYPVPRSRFDMFNFGDGSSTETRRLIDSGHFPWWSDPHVHLAMLRPLCSALIAFDFAAFGLSARYFHWHSFLWWALLVIAVALVLWEAMPPPMAALATLLFALEEGHSLPLGWLANRSTLVATAFGFLALYAHMLWRKRAGRVARALSIVFIVLAASAGEYAFSAFAYFAAYELSATRGPDAWRARARGLAPVVVTALIYLGVRSALGYGIVGSGFYLSPTAAPLAFVAALLWRIPVLVAELAFGVPADWYTGGSPWRDYILQLQLFPARIWLAFPDWRVWHVAIGVCALTIVLLCLRRFRAIFGDALAQSFSWLLWGALLSLIPVAGGMVSARLTVAAALGFDAAIAALLFALFLGVSKRPSWLGRSVCLVLCAVLLWIHVDAASERDRAEAAWQRYRSELENTWVLRAELDEARIAQQHVMVIASQDLTSAWYLPYVRRMAQRPMPKSYLLLSGAAQPQDLVRVADNAIELVVLTSDVAMMAVGGNYRPANEPFHVGDVLRVDGVRVDVLRVLFGQPQAVRFTFPASVDDPRYWFLYPGERGLRRVVMPKVGERLRLRRPMYPSEEALQAQEYDRQLERTRVQVTPN